MTLKQTLLGTTLLFSSALMAVAESHSQRTIGQTTALIPEAGLATTELKDGESGLLFPKFLWRLVRAGK